MPSRSEISTAIAAVSRILREGRLTELGEAAMALESALAAATDPSPDEQEALRLEAVGLKRQLEAAARGIRAAQARLSEIREASHAPTYDSAGRRRSLGSDATLARRL